MEKTKEEILEESKKAFNASMKIYMKKAEEEINNAEKAFRLKKEELEKKQMILDMNVNKSE